MLWRLELAYGCQIYVTHVLGTCIQAQWTDGGSRRLFKEGVTAELNMLSFCPWHRTLFSMILFINLFNDKLIVHYHVLGLIASSNFSAYVISEDAIW